MDPDRGRGGRGDIPTVPIRGWRKAAAARPVLFPDCEVRQSVHRGYRREEDGPRATSGEAIVPMRPWCCAGMWSSSKSGRSEFGCGEPRTLRQHRHQVLQDVRLALVHKPRELRELLRGDAGDVLQRDFAFAEVRLIAREAASAR